jgi:hypothetical protein
MCTNSQPSSPPGTAAVAVVLARAIAGDTVARACDAAQLLDVDVDELAGTGALVAESGLETEPTQAAQPDPGQDPGHGRQRHRERLGDLRGRHPQPAQLRDYRDPCRIGAIRDLPRRRRTVK